MKALYAGSFDPLTFGHVDLITRFAPKFERFFVAVASSEDKNYLLPLKTRFRLVQQVLRHVDNLHVGVCFGLLVDYAQQVGADVLLRGLRGPGDLHHESKLAFTNVQLSDRHGCALESLFVLAHPQYAHLSSRWVKELARLGGDLKPFVPQEVAAALKESTGVALAAMDAPSFTKSPH